MTTWRANTGRNFGSLVARLLALGVVAAWCGLLECAPAAAQVASQITPGSFAPPIQGGLGGGASVGASPGLDTPPGADKLFVTLRAVTIEGGFPELAGGCRAPTSSPPRATSKQPTPRPATCWCG